jgi:hypothetical protein
MGLFKKSTPPPVQPDEPDQPVWLFRTPHQVADDAWVYQVARAPRSWVEQYGILSWDTMPGVQQVASDYMNREHTTHAVLGITLHGEWNQWDLPCPPPPLPGSVKPLDAAQMAEYQQLLEFALTGEEQGRLSPEELKAYLDVQLRDVPMASWQKPDINGLREGDRVRLVEDFNGEEVSYGAGSTGTIIIVSTAPAEIRMNREIGLHYVGMDESELGHGIIMAKHDQIERIPGHADVTISGDGRVSIANVPSS